MQQRGMLAGETYQAWCSARGSAQGRVMGKACLQRLQQGQSVQAVGGALAHAEATKPKFFFKLLRLTTRVAVLPIPSDEALRRVDAAPKPSTVNGWNGDAAVVNHVVVGPFV